MILYWLVMMETTIYDFRTSFYIPTIHKLAFNLPHVRILGTNHCGSMRHTDFKQHELFQDVLCRRNYNERVVASFAHQIKSEYYGGNIYVYINGIELEDFSAFTKGRYQYNYIITSSSCSISLFFHLVTENRILPILMHTEIA